jgi:hypothetical protein
MSRILFLLIGSIGFSGLATADPLLNSMRSLSADGPIYAYEMEYQDEEIIATGRIDPSQPEGERIEVLSPSEDKWSDDFRAGLAEMDAETDGDIWCADFAEMVPDNAALIAETDGEATYAFTPMPEADADSMERKMMKKIKGEVTLDKTDGAITAFSMRLPKPYKPAFVVKINAFDMSAKCGRAPDGRTYLEAFSFAIDGSAMMQSFKETTSRKIIKLLDPVG